MSARKRDASSLSVPRSVGKDITLDVQSWRAELATTAAPTDVDSEIATLRDRGLSSSSITAGDASIHLQFHTNSVLEDLRLAEMAEEEGVDRKLSIDKEVVSPRSRAVSMAGLETDVHVVPVEVLEQRFNTSVDGGLDVPEAVKRLEKEGKNVLEPPRDLPLAIKFILYLFEGFGLLLWAGAILCFIAWYPLSYNQPGGIYNLALSLCLVFVIVLSGLFNFLQERRSSRVMEKFRKLLPAQAKVLRGGNWLSVDASELVRGDIVHVKAGEKIPADLRVVSTREGRVDKSALTGEPDAIPLAVVCTDKNHHESRNLAQFGTLLTEGEVTGMVIATGSFTMMGGISKMVNEAGSSQTTLHVEVNHFVQIVAALAIVTGVVSFSYWAGSLRINHPGFLDLPTMIVNCISLIVAYVPLGLPVSVTLTLSLIAAKLAMENVLVKKLGIVDTLGCVSTIASDKTGTLTENRMSLAHILTLRREQAGGPLSTHVRDSKKVSGVDEDLEDVFRAAVLCSRADFAPKASNLAKPVFERAVEGDATECGIFRFCACLDERRLSRTRELMPKLSEVPFNSRQKWQMSLHWEGDANVPAEVLASPSRTAAMTAPTLLVMKGAPERIINFCTSVRVAGGETVPLAEDGKAAILEGCESLAANGERVLGLCDLAVGPLSRGAGGSMEEGELVNLASQGMRFVGLVSLMDPPRAEVPAAIAVCRSAGIRVMMVTGDHHSTAAAIARMVGIITAERVCGVDYLANLADQTLSPSPSAKADAEVPAIVLTGEQLNCLTEPQWAALLQHREIVFARTTPAQKLLIAQHVQETGQRVGMTGDGVNDAPALRQANVGIAMGRTGTDVAKEAASIILLDDNFTSIVKGIERGRLAFENLKKIVSYLIPAGSFSEATPIIANVFLGMPLPLSPFLMIIICMLTDVSGSVSLVYEVAERDLMNVPPRDAKRDKLVSFNLMCYGFLQLGVYESFVGFFMYFYAMNHFSGGRVRASDLVFAWQAWNEDEGYAGLSLDQRNEILFQAQTAYFVALVMVQIWNLVGVARTRRISVFNHPWNKYTLFGAAAEIVISVLMTFLPFINDIFYTRPLPFVFFVYPFLFGAALMLIMEALKALRRRFHWAEVILGW